MRVPESSWVLETFWRRWERTLKGSMAGVGALAPCSGGPKAWQSWGALEAVDHNRRPRVHVVGRQLAVPGVRLALAYRETGRHDDARKLIAAADLRDCPTPNTPASNLRRPRNG